MAAMHRQRLLRKGVKSLPTNCAWFVGLAILWHVSHFQCLSRTASMGRVRWRKLVLLSLLMGLSKQLTSSNSFITWASLCEMVYSLRIRLCGVSYPPNLSPRRLFAYFPLQGCTDPPTPPRAAVRVFCPCKCIEWCPFPCAKPLPSEPAGSSDPSVGLWKRKRKKTWGANQGRLSAWGWEQKHKT